LGLQFAEIMGGAVVTEIIFGWPGVGTLTLDAVMRRDYPVVQATLLVISLVYAAGNLMVDLLYGLLDPRIRYS
jgi:peptide/nickel transport system permease protein